MSNFSIPQTRIPAFRHRDCKGISRKPKTREQLSDEEARAYHRPNATCKPRVDVPVPMPQAHVAPGKVVYLRWSEVDDEHRQTAQSRRLARGVVTSWPGDWERDMVMVSWDFDSGELWPAAWLADAPEWG
jgi:hypothetical protein